MRIIVAVLTVGIVAGGYTMPARAIGCVSGGLAGAVAGHMVHHGVLGALGGCIAGHQYNKHQKARSLEQQNAGSNGYPAQGGYTDNRAPSDANRSNY